MPLDSRYNPRRRTGRAQKPWTDDIIQHIDFCTQQQFARNDDDNYNNTDDNSTHTHNHTTHTDRHDFDMTQNRHNDDDDNDGDDDNDDADDSDGDYNHNDYNNDDNTGRGDDDTVDAGNATPTTDWISIAKDRARWESMEQAYERRCAV